MALARSNGVGDILLVRIQNLGTVVHLHVEIALILLVVAQVADARHGQVAVYGLLVIYRNIVFQFGFLELGARGRDLYFWTAIGLNLRFYAVAGSVILAILQSH